MSAQVIPCFINSRMTIVLSNVNVSEIKMGLLMDGAIDTMKCDEMWAMTVSFLCLFAVGSVPTLLLLGFVREGTVVPSCLANCLCLGTTRGRPWWRLESGGRRSQSVSPSASRPGQSLLPHISCPCCCPAKIPGSALRLHLLGSGDPASSVPSALGGDGFLSCHLLPSFLVPHHLGNWFFALNFLSLKYLE